MNHTTVTVQPSLPHVLDSILQASQAYLLDASALQPLQIICTCGRTEQETRPEVLTSSKSWMGDASVRKKLERGQVLTPAMVPGMVHVEPHTCSLPEGANTEYAHGGHWRDGDEQRTC